MRDEASQEDRPDTVAPETDAIDEPGAAPDANLSPEEKARADRIAAAAARALAEAEARRADETPLDLPKELGGRDDGPEAVRYGDWEKKGIAVDF
ncbi:MAG: DUF1674 domain-containing protein [Pseudomonadota bacterium]